MNQKFVCYPSQLPTLGLTRQPRRTIWTEPEDMLLAQGLERIASQDSKLIRQSKTNMHDLSVTLNAKYLPGKCVEQISFRLKNNRRPCNAGSLDNPNPVQYFF